MADNVAYKSDATTTVATIRTDEDTGGHVQYIKPMFGGDGTFTIVTASAGMPVTDDGSFTLAANSGVDIGDVDILSIAAGDNNIGNVDIVTAPARDRTTDNVGVAEDVNSLMNDTTVLTVKFANINDNTSGNNAIVAAVGGAKIRVLSVALFIEGATSVNTYWNDGTADLMGDATHLIPLSNDGATGAAGFILPYNPKGWFETAAVNRPVNLNLSGAVDVAGCLTYVEV